MKINILKTIRIILALLVFVPLALFFSDFTGRMPVGFSALAKIQLVPAILSGALVTIIVLLLLTMIFGRVYCSVICPLGILQDLVSRFSRIGKKKKKRLRFDYAKPLSILRYTILAVCVVFFVFGIITPLAWLDPYTNFGRIAVNIFRPAAVFGNNALNWIALKFDNYSFYNVTLFTITAVSFGIAFFALLVVGVMAVLRGRLFCNSICPVGSLLGLISRFSLFKIGLNEAKCTSCSLCEKACKAQCIDSKNKRVDNSRCVTCFNCLKRCKSDGVGYRFAYGKRTTEALQTAPEAVLVSRFGITRRSFIATSGAMAATLPMIPAIAKAASKEIDGSKLTPITPPGSISLKHFKEKCTGCHLCITHCPNQCLKPAGFNFGIEYAFKPHLSYYEKAYCNYNCTICSEVCPNGAIIKQTSEAKTVIQIGIAHFTKERCIVYRDKTSCGACAEHCPVKAVEMVPYEGSLTIPFMTDELCIGCGGCESICPAEPLKAINVWANNVHQTAQKPKEEEIKEIDPDELDFGF
ncbi:MAG: 4Fe-4S binding protein [Dysgonamonadaceae bacterium]|jgi:ferredoxin|nr:4Fe-4S binding protein [Dysgonamonadaceae bacterium]